MATYYGMLITVSHPAGGFLAGRWIGCMDLFADLNLADRLMTAVRLQNFRITREKTRGLGDVVGPVVSM